MTVSNVGGVRADIAQMLEKIRDVSSRAKVFDHNHGVNKSADFSKVFQSTQSVIGNINDLQNTTDALKDKYVSGDPNVSLSQVVVANEKSKLAFEGLIIVRNKCLEAYKEIMNMPV